MSPATLANFSTRDSKQDNESIIGALTLIQHAGASMFKVSSLWIACLKDSLTKQYVGFLSYE